ncbi:hypothetical protein G6F22_018289 [Rhizopus arrhizus]|nr:hypothetical protein G6F22_018289 [Rhizopus arrhizus]
METKANYVLIGAFTLITGLALLAFGLWAAKYSSDRTWQEYRPGAVQRHRGRFDHRTEPGAGRSAPGGRTHPPELDHAGQDRYPRQAGDHQPHRPVDHPAQRRYAAVAGVDHGQQGPGTDHPDHAFGAAEHHRRGQPHRRTHGPDPQRPQRRFDQRDAGQS